MKKAYVSNNTIRRLPKYLRKLQELGEQGISRISSGKLGELLGLTPSQIRQDFSCFGEFGQQGYGYNVVTLAEAIEKILGVFESQKAIIIGVGNIGRALIESFDFEKCGVELAAAFDTDNNKIGNSINGISIISYSDVIDYIRTNSITIAVLAVPKVASQEVADNLKNSCIEAIWNFTNVDIDVGADMLVENVHFSDSMLALKYYIFDNHRSKAGKNRRADILPE